MTKNDNLPKVYFPDAHSKSNIYNSCDNKNNKSVLENNNIHDSKKPFKAIIENSVTQNDEVYFSEMSKAGVITRQTNGSEHDKLHSREENENKNNKAEIKVISDVLVLPKEETNQKDQNKNACCTNI